ncbi:hypothetical protein E4O04_05920 [Treponema sp. OMZ 799]|uniref:hypothetical protein n=1 Tax=Treponema sp. OMZ 799 TaxID=2563668 RepID=UPI0020A36B94|nr:hypothetical protein [Treponema sp. OMZ 799]UTC77563.1 hypothetical protein E4O04_05920 [Treponema sp. OMZ 799]
MTNEQILEAVNRLTETYNEVKAGLGEVKKQAALLQPLYKNGQIIWDGREDFQMTDEPITNLIGVGTQAITKYGKWYAQYMIKLTGHTVISNCETQTPTNYIVVKIKLPENKDGTFFIKYANSDNWSHGIATAWMCNADKSIKTLLGSQVADKHADYAKSVVFNPKNQDAWDSRYYQWIGFNYNKEDIIKDDEGYSYIALSGSVATWNIGGWAVAERNTDFLWTPARIFDLEFYNPASKSTHNSLFRGLTLSHFIANKKHTNIKIPYSKTGNLIIGIFCSTDHLTPNPAFSGFKTNTEFPFDKIICGNFAKIKQPLHDYQWGFVHVPEQEVIQNTVEINGLKLLQFNIDVPENERHFYFAGMFTESEV